MSPFGALSRNRGSRKPVAYNSALNPSGTLGCASAGRSTMCGRLIASAFEAGGGKSCIVILRVTPGASLVQSPIAALPVSTLPFSPAAPAMTAMTKTLAKKIVRKIPSLDRRAFIVVESFGRQITRGLESSGPESMSHSGAIPLVFFKTATIETHEQENACCSSPASRRAV